MMTQSEFATLLDEIQEQEREVREAGQREYAHDEDNCHANFDRLAKMLNLNREQVLMVYAVKHWDGIVSWVNGHTSQREDVRGRIKDLRLYLGLLWGMIEDRESPAANDVDRCMEQFCPSPKNPGPFRCKLRRGHSGSCTCQDNEGFAYSW